MFSVLPNACGSSVLRGSTSMHCPKQEAKLGLNSCSKFAVLFSVGYGQINATGNYKYKMCYCATIRDAFRNNNDKI